MTHVRRAPSKIPAFNSIEEEAAFWDSHSTTEFEDEWEPVEVEVAPDLRSVRVVEIELDDETADLLFALARQRGVRASELARSWIRDQLASVVSGTDEDGSTGRRSTD